MRISVLTPTYNRGKLLNRLYYSLVKKFEIWYRNRMVNNGRWFNR